MKRFKFLALLLALFVAFTAPAMAGTYDLTGDGGTAPAADRFGQYVVYRVELDTPTLIAANATLTTNAKITANDVLQVLDVPAGFLFLGSALYTVTPEGAAETIDLGIAGGDEIQDGASTNGTAGTVTLTLVGDDWGGTLLTGYYFSAADTIDATYKNDTTVFSGVLYVYGLILDLP